MTLSTIGLIYGCLHSHTGAGVQFYAMPRARLARVLILRFEQYDIFMAGRPSNQAMASQNFIPQDTLCYPMKHTTIAS